MWKTIKNESAEKEGEGGPCPMNLGDANFPYLGLALNPTNYPLIHFKPK